MSTIWTPSGEYRPTPTEPEPAQHSAEPPAEGMPAGGAPTPEEVEAMRRQVLAALATPVLDHIAGHVSGLIELAALHLEGSVAFGGKARPDLAEASLAIDTVGALIEGLGPKLGRFQPDLTRTLADLRMAYVEVANSPPSAA